MSSTVNAVSAATITSYTFDALWSMVGVFVIELLVALLVQKELFRILGERQSGWLQALDVAIAPLLLAFGLNMAVRVLNLITIPSR